MQPRKRALCAVLCATVYGKIKGCMMSHSREHAYYQRVTVVIVRIISGNCRSYPRSGSNYGILIYKQGWGQSPTPRITKTRRHETGVYTDARRVRTRVGCYLSLYRETRHCFISWSVLRQFAARARHRTRNVLGPTTRRELGLVRWRDPTTEGRRHATRTK